MAGALRDNTSIWRQPPSPEVDQAWDWLSAQDVQLITVSTFDLLRSGKDPTISVKAPASWLAGEDAYIAQVEVFHQIHCLNVLRKELHPDYYFKHRGAPSELDLSHLSHCIHMLLQHLMCSADVSISSHYWLYDENYNEPKTRPFADFSIEKKCRNFDGLMAWLRDEGGVRDVQRKFPMKFPGHTTPVFTDKGYSVTAARKAFK